MRKYVDESHVSSADSKKNVLDYLMRDVNSANAESNILVIGLSYVSNGPHTHNRKAFNLKLKKNAQNKYSSRLSFDMTPLAQGEYTFCIEYFPPKMVGVLVNVVSSSLNITGQSTKVFPTYTRSIIHVHKWSVVPPVVIDVDLRCDGTASDVAYLIIYGIQGSQSDVSSDVYDSVYVIESNRMVMETDLDLNGNRILNDNISPYTKNISYRKVFEQFVDLTDPSAFNLIGESAKIYINKIDQDLVINKTDISSYDPAIKGFNVHGSHLQLQKTFNQDDNFTLFISFKHDSELESYSDSFIGFGDSSSTLKFVKYYVDNNSYSLLVSNTVIYSERLIAGHADKAMFLWIVKNGNNFHFKLSAHTGNIFITLQYKPAFQANKFWINLKFVINKIGFSDKAYDIGSIGYGRIFLQEKQNGVSAV